MSHNIIIETEIPLDGMDTLPTHLRSTITTALEMQEIVFPCEINVLLTDDEGIHEINLDSRGVDKPTDVLSFPMFELEPGEPPHIIELDPETGLCPLGDMVLSLPRATVQAEEYGHSVMREISYLTVHSVLHLLGYDHLDEAEQKKQMRAREKEIMNHPMFEEKG